jgi:Ran GTPase-activating protein (RanGAP) involved in mRNA processing and transport
MYQSTKKKKKGNQLPPPPTLTGSFRLIQKLGRRKNKNRQTNPIECNLQGLLIEDEGAIALINALMGNNVQATILDLSMCGLTNTAAIKIAEFLFHDKVCHTLCLQGNQIEDEGGAAIAKSLMTNCTITSLRFEDNRLGAGAGHAFGQALRKNSTAFREFNFLANPFGSEGISPIFMGMSSNRSRILSVHLRRCDIDSLGCIILADALRTNETITSIDLQSNLICDEGAAALASALKNDNRTLRVLDLRNNLISTAMYSLEEMISTNRSIRLLQVEGNDFAGDWEDLTKRLTRQMDFNEIGYWKIVEKEMKEERERIAAEMEAEIARKIEQDLLENALKK